MRILWFTWKDSKHPFAGGAESVDANLAKQLVQDGHELIMLTGGFKGGKSTETHIDGYKIVRVGNYFTVYFEAFKYYKKHLRGWADIIIEEINTIPFMTQWYTKEPRVLLVYQLCRIIWFYQIFFPLNIVGYVLEPIYLWLLRNNQIITESNSTKQNFLSYGFNPKNIHLLPISIDIKPLASIGKKKTYDDFTIISLGSIRSMKQTLDQVKAFEIAKESIPELKIKIAGIPVGTYGEQFISYIKNSQYKKDIEFFGSVSREKKIELMQKSHLILVTSIKEGWGLIVTEAASQGTPAVVYNVDGLRDSVVPNKTGHITSKNTPESMASEIVTLYKDKKTYKNYQLNALKDSKQYTESHSYEIFKKHILKHA